MRPDFKLIVDSKDQTEIIRKRLVSLEISDERGVHSDQLTLTLDDEGHVLAIPRKGAVIQVAIGYQETGLNNITAYTVDEVFIKSPPSQMIVSARGANLREGFKAPRNRSWDDTTIGDIVTTIAKEHNLIPHVDAVLASIPIAHIDQTESDLHLLNRLAQENYAMWKPSGPHLIFAKLNETKAVSGKKLPVITINRKDVTRWSVSLPDRSKYNGVICTWHDIESAVLKTELAGENIPPVWEINEPFPTQIQAKQKAISKFNRLQLGKGQLSITLPGDNRILAKSPLSIVGFRPGVDGDWVVKSVRHMIGGSGYATSIQADPKL